MNIVHLLSPAVDLRPLYKLPIPLECALWGSKSLLASSSDFWNEALPGQNHLIIDPGQASVYYEMAEEADVLSLPGANTAQALFIYAAFILGMEWDGQTLFLPGHFSWSDAESMGYLLRLLQKDDMAASVFIQFAHQVVSSRERLFIPGNTLHKAECFELISMQKSISYYEYKDKKESEPSFSAYSLLPLFYFNALHFQEYSQDWTSDYQDLFYLLSDAFRDGSAGSSLLSEVILKLQEWNLLEIKQLIPDVMLLPLNQEYTAFYDMAGFADLLDRDENMNYIQGPVEAVDCHDCVILNHSGHPLIIERQSQKLILLSQTSTRITSL